MQAKLAEDASPLHISFPQVATCGYENPAFQAVET
jgi:hypothetical protein